MTAQDWIDIGKFTLEKLSSWPVVTLLVLFLFRNPISTLLNRIHTFKAGKEGVTIDASAAIAVQAETKVETGLKTPEAEARLQQVRKAAVSPSVQQREQRIRADIQTMNLQPTATETVDLLIEHLAMTQALHAAEKTYRTIFGSQIGLLKALNLTGTYTRAQAELFYLQAQASFPEMYATYSFQQWLNYLIAAGLLMSPDNEQFTITTDGKEFLKWMTQESVYENKPF